VGRGQAIFQSLLRAKAVLLLPSCPQRLQTGSSLQPSHQGSLSAQPSMRCGQAGNTLAASPSPLNASQSICLMSVPTGARTRPRASQQFGATAAAQQPSPHPHSHPHPRICFLLSHAPVQRNLALCRPGFTEWIMSTHWPEAWLGLSRNSPDLQGTQSRLTIQSSRGKPQWRASYSHTEMKWHVSISNPNCPLPRLNPGLGM
jgi:hypothetical protein